ncbi:Metallophosphoesterase [Candidatus Methylobacter favarea]|uniref:Metallophosphoesterase n=1 Tax=Candidatus Methylobacter favarea TaxID=2707345 RepID=A0A8S0WMJ7_9GAMM|nr:metallophosphoesterase family protein [Candidatus Methylobacter favarea]CAA9889810.1 Metallophosphoesterase [Candidatus Methylobacter favarea]
MSVILHLSDPHFGTEQPDVAAALIQLAHQQRPDLAVISGDITQRARPRQFAAAKAFIDALKTPANLVVAGNHDIPLFNVLSRIFWPYANYQWTFGKNLEPVFESDSLLAIAVKTTRRYRHIHGELSAEQIDRVSRLLVQAKPAQLRLVIAHHPLWVSRLKDEVNVVRGRDAAIDKWTKAGADLILGGHIHLPFIIPLRHKLPEINNSWVVQAGTAVSDRVRWNAGNSVNIIRFHAADRLRHCSVERWDYRHQQAIFSRVANEILPLAAIDAKI